LEKYSENLRNELEEIAKMIARKTSIKKEGEVPPPRLNSSKK
jgi:hypothetical protein